MDSFKNILPRVTQVDAFVLALSFVVLATLGCSHVAHVWLARTLPVDAALRCGTLVASLLAIHLVGWNELRAQRRWPTMRLIYRVRLNARRLNANAPIKLTFFAQLFVIVFASLLIDGGDVLKVCLASAAVYWSVIACALLWRTRRLTHLDRALVRYGFFSLLPIVFTCWSIVIALKAGHYHAS